MVDKHKIELGVRLMLEAVDEMRKRNMSNEVILTVVSHVHGYVWHEFFKENVEDI